MDNLKRFFESRMEQDFYPFENKEEVWMEIEKHLPSNPVHRRTISIQLWQIAASMAILILGGLWAWHNIYSKAEILDDPKLVSVQKVHASLISAYDVENITPEDQLSAGFLELVEAEKNILEDLKNTPPKLRGKAIEALKINYENQLIMLEEIENQKNILNNFKSITYENHGL